MGTRSAIAVAHGPVIKAVYCHWDGYLDHNGRVLLEHYNSAKANNLVALGDLSSLRKDIGEEHPFDNPHPYDTQEWKDFRAQYENMCTFYGRDRKEEGTSWRVFHSREEYVEAMDHSGCEYFYLMDNGVWYVSEYGRPFQELKIAIDSLKENEDA